MRRFVWWLLPLNILLVGCPGPEDRGKLEAIASFEGFVDKLMQKLGPEQEVGQGFSLTEEGGGPGTLWSLALSDYMVRPLAQPADSWLGDMRITLVRTSEECSPTQQPIEIYADFIGDATQWTLYSVVSRMGSRESKPNTQHWRVWESDSEDWKYLVEITAAVVAEQNSMAEDGINRESAK